MIIYAVSNLWLSQMIRCVVIGTGRIALSHIPHMICNSKVDVVAAVEPNFIMRLVMRKLLKISVYKSVDSVTMDSIDAALILTPPSAHFELTKRYLTEGKHVFVEKPLTLDPDESSELLELARSNKLQISSGYVYRFHPIYRKVKQILKENSFGVPESCSIEMVGNVVSESNSKSWRSTGKGAGCLYDYGCHAIDLAIFFFGKPKTVECLSKTELFQVGVVDRFKARLNQSIPVEISCDWANESVRKAGLKIIIRTDRNILVTDGQSINVEGEDNISIKDLDTDVSYYLRGEEFQMQMDTFFEAISSGKLEWKSAEEAVICDQIISDLYEVIL